MLTAAVILVAIALTILQYCTQRRPKNFPPGPWGLPLLGYLPFLKLPPEEGLARLSKKYGCIYSVFFANYPFKNVELPFRVVLISNLSIMKEALKDDKFAGRPPIRFFKERSLGVGGPGIIGGNGKSWAEQRRFALKCLRDFGFGKGSMEILIKDEALELISGFRKDLAHPISLERRFNAAALNCIWNIISGERYAHDDPRLMKILSLFIDSFAEAEVFGPLFLMDWLTKAFPNLSGWNKFMSTLPPTLEFLQGYIDTHKRSRDPANPRDFIDAYLNEIENTNDVASSFYREEGAKSLLGVLLDLFLAGVESTSTSLTWAILYLIHFPEAQEKAYAEIESIIGTERSPSLSDRPKMPYMESFISETLRKSSITPIGIVHSTTEDTTFHGYSLPKDTMVMGNIWQFHNDPEYWGDPENFRPERFLTSSGNSKLIDGLISFSAGKRACLGEGLARNQLFLFLTSLIQQFQFAADPTNPMPSMKGRMGTVTKPVPFQVIATARVR